MEYIDLLNEIKTSALEKERALYTAKNCLKNIEKDIVWYKNYNPDYEKNKAEKAKLKIPVFEKEKNDYINKSVPIKEELDEVSKKIFRWYEKLFNPGVAIYCAFSKKQKNYRNLEKELKDKYNCLMIRIDDLSRLIDRKKYIIQQFNNDKEKFKKFDLNNSMVLQQNLKDDIAIKEKEYQQFSDHYTFICNKIQPLVDKINEKIDKSNEIQKNIEKAEEWEDELNYAVKSYDRAMIHQKCKNEFGDGSPRKVISHFTGVNERLRDDIEILDNKICCEIKKHR